MRENGKSSAQTERLRKLRKPSNSNKTLIYSLLGISLLLIICAGAWHKISKDAFSNSLPHAAQGSTLHLISALQACTDNLALYGLDNSSNAPRSATESKFDFGCVSLADPAHRATALHLASRSGNLENVVLLLESGAKVGAADRLGLTPLHLAATDEISVALLKAGADPLSLDQFDRTPLFTCKSEGQVVTLTSRHPSQFVHKDKNGATALQVTLRKALATSSTPSLLAIQKAGYLISHIPSEYVDSMVKHEDFGRESALQLMVSLASVHDSERRMPGVALLSQALSRIVLLGSADVIDRVAALDLASRLVAEDALGSIAALQSSRIDLSLVFDVTRVDSTGRYPISYSRSAQVLQLLISHGASLHPQQQQHTETSTAERKHDPVHQLLQSLSTQRGASMASQFKLVKAIKENDPNFSSFLSSVPKEIEMAIERRFMHVNAGLLEWNVDTFLLGMELLSDPSYQSYSRIPLTAHDTAQFPHLLAPRTSAQFDLTVAGMDLDSQYVIDLDIESEVDNVNLQVMHGDSLQATLSSSNSFFGSMPRIRLPIEKRTAISSDPHFKVILSCNNHLMACTAELNVLTAEVDDHLSTLRTPLVHSQFNYAFHLYSISRIATIMWLPMSILPKSVPLIVRFAPFFVSLIGFYPAGPVFVLYWLAYTTISHVVIRVIGL